MTHLARDFRYAFRGLTRSQLFTSVVLLSIGLGIGTNTAIFTFVEGYETKPGEHMNPYCNAVSTGYFKTMGIPLLVGRDFDDRDVRFETADPNRNLPPPYKVAIGNESFAKHYFGDRSPDGRHIGFGTNPGTKTPIQIIGVV